MPLPPASAAPEPAPLHNPFTTPVRLLQDATASAVAATAKGCVWNQDVPALVKAAGLRLVSVTRHTGGTLVSLVAVRDV
jgi:hypothetical protein